MNVENFLKCFVSKNIGKHIETGITSILVYKDSIRLDPIALITYDENRIMEVRKPGFSKKIMLDETEKEKILKSKINRLGHGSLFELEIVI